MSELVLMNDDFCGHVFSQLQFSLEPEPVAINCTAFNHNGNLLVTGAADGVIRLFGQCSLLTIHDLLHCRLSEKKQTLFFF